MSDALEMPERLIVPLTDQIGLLLLTCGSRTGQLPHYLVDKPGVHRFWFSRVDAPGDGSAGAAGRPYRCLGQAADSQRSQPRTLIRMPSVNGRVRAIFIGMRVWSNSALTQGFCVGENH